MASSGRGRILARACHPSTNPLCTENATESSRMRLRTKLRYQSKGGVLFVGTHGDILRARHPADRTLGHHRPSHTDRGGVRQDGVPESRLSRAPADGRGRVRTLLPRSTTGSARSGSSRASASKHLVKDRGVPTQQEESGEIGQGEEIAHPPGCPPITLPASRCRCSIR